MEHTPLGSDFLQHYGVHNRPEVIAAAQLAQQNNSQTDIIANRSKRIEAYIDQFSRTFLNPNPWVREHSSELLYDQAVIKPENFPESYFKQVAREWQNRGHGYGPLTTGERETIMYDVIEAQRLSLNSWINHLSAPTNEYPPSISYFVMNGVLKLGKFDTQTYTFAKREKSTIAPFAEIDHEALSRVMGSLEAMYFGKPTDSYPQSLLDLIDRRANFGTLYARTMQELDKATGRKDLVSITTGEWRLFQQESDPQELVDSLAGTRSNLCLADIGDATSYLDNFDIEIYFSHDRSGNPTIPRLAIAHDESEVAEVRGTRNANQDIDPDIEATTILEEKLASLPGGEHYLKQVRDMKCVTDLFDRTFSIDEQGTPQIQGSPQFTADELRFLYELDEPIRGFGQDGIDPRVRLLQVSRSAAIDAPILLNCDLDNIAWSAMDIEDNTRTYIGLLSSRVISKLPQLEHVYTSFPHGEIKRYNFEIGGMSKDDLIDIVHQRQVVFEGDAPALVHSKLFRTQQQEERISTVLLSAKDLGLSQSPDIYEIYAAAEQFGLELLSPEVALYFAYTTSPNTLKENVYIASSIMPMHNERYILRVSNPSGKELRIGDRYVGNSLRMVSFAHNSRFLFGVSTPHLPTHQQ